MNDLRKKWNPVMSWEEYKELCDEMTEKRKGIKAKKGINPIRGWCKHCQGYHIMEPAPISIRSLLFALKKISLINDKEFKKLNSEWKKYQRINNLNAYGEKKRNKNTI